MSGLVIFTIEFVALHLFDYLSQLINIATHSHAYRYRFNSQLMLAQFSFEMEIKSREHTDTAEKQFECKAEIEKQQKGEAMKDIIIGLVAIYSAGAFCGTIQNSITGESSKFVKSKKEIIEY